MTVFSGGLGDALTYAAAAHGDQRRKGSEIPYIHHPIAVAALVIEHGGDEDQAAAALLHDVLEDCGPHHGVEIERRFGRKVLAIVGALTDGLPDAAGVKPPWRERKITYIAHLGAAPREALIVCAADKLHNAEAIANDHAVIGDAVFERFKPTKADTLWYYRSLASALAERLGADHPILRRLGAAVDRWADEPV